MSRTFNIFSRINAWTKISYVPENSDANWQRHTLKSSFPVREPGCILMVRMDWMTRKDKRDSYAKDGSKEGHGGRTEPQPPWIECDVNGMGNLPVLHKDWWKGQWNPWNAESHKGDRLPRLHPPDVEMLAIAVRRHWHIENGLHWTLDVVFREDKLRSKEKKGIHNLGLIRRFVMFIIWDMDTRYWFSIQCSARRRRIHLA